MSFMVHYVTEILEKVIFETHYEHEMLLEMVNCDELVKRTL